MTRWKWVDHDGQRLHGIGVNPDGTLHNPNGYPEQTVRAAVAAAEQRRHAKRSAAATKAAETRRRRRAKHVYDVAQRIIKYGAQCGLGPTTKCAICGRALDDPESITRAIGSECWQDVLKQIELTKAGGRRAAP